MVKALRIETAGAVELVLQRALEDHKAEDDLRFTHRMALRRLQGDQSHPDYEIWGRQERRLWALIQLLNSRIGAARLDVVDLDEEILEVGRRLNAWAVAPE